MLMIDMGTVLLLQLKLFQAEILLRIIFQSLLMTLIPVIHYY